MLERTFQHIPGVGQKTERKLWARGCTSWTKVLESDFGLPQDVLKRLRAAALESKGRLAELDNVYFRERLPSKLSWRAFESFREHACFLDIETTGLSASRNDVTTVCVHSRRQTKSFICGKNMEELPGHLEGYRYIVTFNGARFDLPFLTERLGIRFQHLHMDLLYPLRELGHKGGLKAIETELGMRRSTEGVDGLDAVRLWHAYRHDREVHVAGKRLKGDEALKLLVEYNKEDTVNLEALADYAVAALTKRVMRGVESANSKPAIK